MGPWSYSDMPEPRLAILGPPTITRASYKHQQRNPGVTEMAEMPGRGHALTIDNRWREVAGTALAFVQRFTSPQPAQTGPAGS